jgi:Holliday junction DNA helicase RuvA
MISRIEGLLISKKPPVLEINVGGIVYAVLAPMGTFYHLHNLGAAVTLYTHFVVREDSQQLYGFATTTERDLFRALIKINGVGPKLALTILSGMSAEQFVECITMEDADQLTRIPGIGKKTAQRLLIDIKDRLKDMDTSGITLDATQLQSTTPTPQTDALAALTALGYKPTEAKKALAAINADDADSEQLIKDALQWLTGGGK